MFHPRNPEFALYLGGDYIFCFGNDIMLINNCNKEKGSMCKFPEDYECLIYISNFEKYTYLTGGV